MDVGLSASFSGESHPYSLKRKGASASKSHHAHSVDPTYSKKLKEGEEHSSRMYEDDKENIHRALTFRSRTRSSKVLYAISIDAPTDCSDIEIEMDSSDDDSFTGVLFHQQTERIADKANVHHNFSVYEDPPAN